MPNNNWKRNALLLGGLIGAVIGVAAAQMLVRQAEASGDEKALTTGKGLQIGMLILGLLRQLLSL
ncbi:MAG: hypothetical protein HYZ26_10595 [Chloroflexi bacterium]|nr:hypothetical protein [Chloroflexota bacterium]